MFDRTTRPGSINPAINIRYPLKSFENKETVPLIKDDLKENNDINRTSAYF